MRKRKDDCKTLINPNLNSNPNNKPNLTLTVILMLTILIDVFCMADAIPTASFARSRVYSH